MLKKEQSCKQWVVIEDYLLIIIKATSTKKRERSRPAPYAAVWLQRRITLMTARRDTAPAVCTTFSSINH
jgi:hypothetical protein